MNTSLADIKRGRPISFTVTYIDPNSVYDKKDFLVKIHDVSEINESADAIRKKNLPPTRGLEKTIVTINPHDPRSDNPNNPVPLEIRPRLETVVKIHARPYGFELIDAHFIYPE